MATAYCNLALLAVHATYNKVSKKGLLVRFSEIASDEVTVVRR